MAGAGVGTSLDLPCLLQARKMTKLEDYMVGVINIFHQYSIRKGNFDTLSKGELMQLMTQELPNAIKVGDASLSQTCPRRMTVGQGRDSEAYSSLRMNALVKTNINNAPQLLSCRTSCHTINSTVNTYLYLLRWLHI